MRTVVFAFCSLLLALNAEQLTAPELGRKAPDYPVTAPGGNQIRLSEALNGAKLFLVFFDAREAPQDLPKIDRITTSRGAPKGIAAVLVDGDRVVRRIFRSGSDIAAGLESWEIGRQIYDSQCARCHGADGADTSYPNTKPLAGLGRKHSEEKIVELTEATGVVDMSRLSEADRRGLGAYVAGL